MCRISHPFGGELNDLQIGRLNLCLGIVSYRLVRWHEESRMPPLDKQRRLSRRLLAPFLRYSLFTTFIHAHTERCWTWLKL